MAAWNLALRFVLEMSALVAIGAAAWQSTDGIVRWVAVLMAPLVAVALWGTLNVQDDPSRSGKAPIEVDGWVRLAVEAVVFGSGTLGLIIIEGLWLGMAFLVLVVVHNVVARNRIVWLLATKS